MEGLEGQASGVLPLLGRQWGLLEFLSKEGFDWWPENSGEMGREVETEGVIMEPGL